ncbi:MAG: DNA-binding protein [Acidimicrobiia bacterium]
MGLFDRSARREQEREAESRQVAVTQLADHALTGVVPIGTTRWRQRVRVAGRVKAIRIQPWADEVASLELTLADDTGGITIVFLGRRRIGGIDLGTHLVAEGMTSTHNGLRTLLNPEDQLLPHEVRLPY